MNRLPPLLRQTLFLMSALAPSIAGAGNLDPAKPNVIMLYFDDLGYGDFGANDPSQTSYTPNLDALAAGGMRFTAGHSADAVCTPSRYALLTGRYAWRTSRKTGVTGGYSSPLMEEDRLTIGKMFQSLDYETAMVGKWHVGMQFYSPTGAPVDLGNNGNVLGTDTTSTTDDAIDFSTALTQTPTAYGFDYFYGTSASLDMPPYAWIENETVLFKGGIVSNGEVDFTQATPATNADFLEGQPVDAVNNVRTGAYDPNFVVSDYLQVQAQKVADLLRERAADGKPFFIYMPSPAPHRPWSVQSQFRGTTPFDYGDYLAQSDHYTGVILDALADPDGDPATNDSLVSNTIVYMTSDNGPENVAMSTGLAANPSHDANGPFRGIKQDNWEGGTRVPFVIRWPAKIAPGSVTDHACWQGDFFATMAEFLNYDLNPDEAGDAESFLPILGGEPMPAARRAGFIQHSIQGQHAIVDQDGIWKLLDGTGNGGRSTSYASDNSRITNATGIRTGTPRQLFNLVTDIGEDNNLLLSPDAAALAKETELYALLNEIRGDTNFGTVGTSNVPPIDTDQDGIPNFFENANPPLDRDNEADAAANFDTDSLTNLQEFQNETDPNNPDTDGDRLQDDVEVLTYNTLPNNANSDPDLLNDGDEILIWNTNPLLADTDGDGVRDDVELANFSNPRNASSFPAGSESTVEVAVSPSIVQLVGTNGTVNDPVVQGDSSSGWAEAGDFFVRERSDSGNNLQWRTQAFVKFDLSELEGEVVSARLRLHQTHRLNSSFSGDLILSQVTADWDAEVGSFPLFAETPVANTFTFGNTSDFGSAVDASGFFSGTVGTVGDDSGFDPDGQVTAIVQDWQSGESANFGFRIAFASDNFTGSAFSLLDDATTAATDESFQLIVTTRALENADSDGDGLADSYELAVFGDLSETGLSDFDGDGVSNLVERALGGDPASASSLPLTELGTSPETLGNFSLHRLQDSGLGYEITVSQDLDTWLPFTQFFRFSEVEPASTLGEDYEKVTIEGHADLPETLFYRVNIRSLPSDN